MFSSYVYCVSILSLSLKSSRKATAKTLIKSITYDNLKKPNKINNLRQFGGIWEENGTHELVGSLCADHTRKNLPSFGIVPLHG